MSPATNGSRIRGKYRRHEDVAYAALRYLQEFGPSTVWRCSYVARRSTLDGTMQILERQGLVKKTSKDGAARIYQITPRGNTYVRAMGYMLEALGSPDFD